VDVGEKAAFTPRLMELRKCGMRFCVRYSEVDENPDYDNLDIVSRDAEDRYFDEDDDDDEEEEDEMEEDHEEENMAE